MFSAKYCLSGPINLSEFSQLVRFLKEQVQSFTHLAVARWQDSMFRGQKS